ncbi:chemotaxis protein CheW [bacterium]|nr:chemotaxis protein CheW [bacterium]
MSSNNNYIEQKKNTHLYFQIGDSKYAINSDNVLEIMKLPALDYPQKLPNNIVGLLKYNNFVINIIDVRFYLNIEVTPYSTRNELLIVKTDEVIFGIITDKVIGIAPFNTSLIDAIPYVDNKMIIDSIYKLNQETIFIINIYNIENILKEHGQYTEHEITGLFPTDLTSRMTMLERTRAVENKTALKFATEEFRAQNKYISFNLNQDLYCIELDYVKEVLKDTSITPVPGTPDYIEGIMNLRGDYITVLNLKKFLNITPSDQPQDKKPVIIIKCNELKLALLIDKINELFECQENNMVETDGYFQNEFIYNGVPYTTLNIDKITSDKKIIITDM